MRFLVTGAAGFIGSTLVDRLLAAGHQVVGIDNLSTGATTNLANAIRCNAENPGRFVLVNVDVQAPELLDIVSGANPDVIVHLAAHVDLRASRANPQLNARVNVLGTINLCEAMRRSGARKVVYAACGGSRYGAPGCLPVAEDCRVAPRSPHAVAKLAGELYLRAYADMYDLAPICLALGSVYGPRQCLHRPGNAIACLAAAMVTGRSIMIDEKDMLACDYVYVDDAVDAFVRAAYAPVQTKGTYNIGTGRYTTLAQLRALVSVLVGSCPVPTPVETSVDESFPIALDPTRAWTALGWRAGVDLVEGVQRTIAWLRATSELESSKAARYTPQLHTRTRPTHEEFDKLVVSR